MHTPKLYVYWFNFQGNIRNFGDELGPYIIQKLSGQKVKYIYVNDVTFKNFPKRLFRIIKQSIKIKKILISDFKTFYTSLFFIDKYIVSVGSIIQYAATPKSIVWGSGINFPDKPIKKAEFRAVRGPLTIERIKACGFDVKGIMLGDPALLLPLIYKPLIKKKYKLGIIAHIAHQKYVEKNCTNSDILIISMQNGNVEEVIDEINHCEQTISSSLHGIIVSHAYNIPCLWFKFPGHIGGKGNIKFADYFKSVKISTYKGFTVSKEQLSDVNFINSIINNNKDKSLPQTNIKEIQSNLLSAAPFKVLEKYLGNDDQ